MTLDTSPLRAERQRRSRHDLKRAVARSEATPQQLSVAAAICDALGVLEVGHAIADHLAGQQIDPAPAGA